MVASMTGFGKGEAEADGYRASVEIRSVNGRYGDVSVHMSRSLAELEPRIKEGVLSVLSRGRIDVSVTLAGGGAEQGLPALNVEVLDAYLEGVEALKKRAGLSGQADLMGMATLPSLFSFEARALNLEAAWAVVEPATRAAVTGCQAMRRTEGEKLAQDFVVRLRTLEALIRKVEALAPTRVVSVRQKLEEKLQDLLGPEQIDPNRLLMEIALLAERSDVTEECVRFHSHNEQFLQTLDLEEAVGRRLNFLLQEMLREANTIGSKAGDAEIAHLVVEMKEELEKLREQVQNVE